MLAFIMVFFNVIILSFSFIWNRYVLGATMGLRADFVLIITYVSKGN